MTIDGDSLVVYNAPIARRKLGLAGIPGSGTVVGPVVSTDNAIARYDGATGQIIQNSAPLVQDDGRITDVTDPTGVQDAATKNYVDGSIAAIGSTTAAAQTTFLVSGGQVVWETAYTFRVSAATYYIMGVLYSSLEQIISLDASDPTDDRIDVIAVDDTGTVVKITGTASAQPSEPETDPGSQLKLALVLVVATTTSPPSVTTTLMYAENAGPPTEWAWTASGAGWNLASANFPRSGVVDIEATNISSGNYIEGVAAAPFDPNADGFLIMYIRSKAAWANNRTLTVQFRLAGVVVGATLTIGNGLYGFNSATLGAYQQIAIPLTGFAITEGATVDRVRLTRAGPSTIGFYLDDISLQQGATTQPPSGGLTQAQADALYAPLIHATRHKTGGADPIALDTLAATTDNTNLNASTTAHGLLKKLSNVATEFLNGQGNFTVPAGGGDVVGPASSVDDNVTTFDGLTGKLIQDSGIPVTRFPSSDEKAALAGTNGVPSAANPYVTDSDPRNTNTRAPTAHASTHENAGGDEISVAGLSGVLADPQTVVVRKNSGANVGTRSRLNFIEGSNVTLTVADDAGDGEVDVTIAAASGAPTTETYLTDADETGTLPNSRRLLAGTDVSFDDTTPGERTINVTPTTQKRGCVLVFCIAFTPLAIGADRGELTVPYDPDDGTTGLTWNVRRITLRVETAGGAPSVRVEKSTASGAFSAATVGDVTLGSGAYEGSNTTALGTVASGNKLRMNILTLATAEYWTVSVELGEN